MLYKVLLIHLPAYRQKINQAMKLVMLEDDASGIRSIPSCSDVALNEISPTVNKHIANPSIKAPRYMLISSVDN